jgi:hypothetical protein
MPEDQQARSEACQKANRPEARLTKRPEARLTNVQHESQDASQDGDAVQTGGTRRARRQDQGQPPPDKDLRTATETVSKEKIGGVCRASSGAKLHPQSKSGDR